MASAADTPSAVMTNSVGLTPAAALTRADRQVADRDQPGAGQVVVARHAGQRPLRDVLLQRCLPQRERPGDAHAGEHLEPGDGPHIEPAADEGRLARRAHEHEGGDAQREPRPPSQQQQVAEHRAQSEAGGDDRPRLRAVHLLGRENRPQHEDRRQDDDVVGRHPCQERCHPPAAAHLGPALLEAGEEVRGGRLGVLVVQHIGDHPGSQRNQAGDRHGERRRVEEERAARGLRTRRGLRRAPGRRSSRSRSSARAAHWPAGGSPARPCLA